MVSNGSNERTFSRHKKSGYKNRILANQLLKNNLIIQTTIFILLLATVHELSIRQYTILVWGYPLIVSGHPST